MSPPSVGLLLLLLAPALEALRRIAPSPSRSKTAIGRPFRRFFGRHQGRLLGYLRSRGVPSSEAEDIVQTAFLYVWEHRNEIDPDQSLRAYLFRIGYTRTMNHLRSASKFDPDATAARLSRRSRIPPNPTRSTPS
jgi:RNA polymerase sigma-70 factor (ECF subfamily)